MSMNLTGCVLCKLCYGGSDAPRTTAGGMAVVQGQSAANYGSTA